MNKERENFFIYVITLAILYFMSTPDIPQNWMLEFSFVAIYLIMLIVFYFLAIFAAVKLIQKKDQILGWTGIGLLVLFGLQFVVSFISGFISGLHV